MELFDGEEIQDSVENEEIEPDKGQLISEGNCGIFNFPKNEPRDFNFGPTRNFWLVF